MNLIQIINMAEPKPAARGMLAKQLSWQAMYQRTKKALDNMFINIQNMAIEQDKLMEDNKQLTEQVKRLQQRNLQLWDTYVARGAHKGTETPQEAIVGVAAQSSATEHHAPPVGGNGEVVGDCSVAAMAAKDAQIEELKEWCKLAYPAACEAFDKGLFSAAKVIRKAPDIVVAQHALERVKGGE